MSEGPRVARFSLRAGAGALVVEVIDAAGRSGIAETVDDPGIRAAVQQLAAGLVGTGVFASRARWDRRPPEPGTLWTAFSALDSAAWALAAAVAERPLSTLLGGQIRDRVSESGPVPDPGALDAGRLGFDETAAALLDQRPAAVLLDPRHWGVTASARLDSLCRALQVSIGFRCETAGPVAANLARTLGLTLPMATLGIVGTAPAPGPIDEWLAAREPVAGSGDL